MPVETLDENLAEVERYELREGLAYRFEANRREFAQLLGAGLVIVVAADAAKAQFGGGGRRGGAGGGRAEKLSARFHFGEDGAVTVMTSKVEVGQGSRTELTQAAAEELRVAVDKIRLVMADTELCPDDGGTAGSGTTPNTVQRIRRSAAAARELLAGLAAERLEAKSSDLTIEDGVFSDPASGKRVTLAELVAENDLAAKLEASPAGDAAVSSPSDWKVLGTAVPKVTGREVVTGALKYPSDVTLEGMLYGKLLRPPSLAATLNEIDLGPAQGMEGVTAVRDGSFVGCTAKTTWQADQAIKAIADSAKWDEPEQPSSDDLFERLKSKATTEGSGFGRPQARTWGQGTVALEAAAKKLGVAYKVSYIQHAPMEPRAAVAEWKDGKLTVWTGSQMPSRVRSDLASMFRVSDDKVRVIVPDTGGGFGGKHSGEAAVEAARLAKAAGKPVKLRWTREEEFTWAYCRPAGLIEVRAGLDDAGRLIAWDFTNYNSGGSSLESPYKIASGRTRFLASESPLRQGSYRALAATANTFARESAMDELADLAGADPLDFRLNHLDDGRLKDVLKAASDKFKWSDRRKGYDRRQGTRGIGLACGTEKGSFVAACAEIEIKEDKIKVVSVCEAFECGPIQNPGNLREQVQGAIVMGLGGALWEQMRFKNGKVLTAHFSEYRVPRMSDLPDLDVVLVNRTDVSAVGAGETPIIAIAPAVANAVFHAKGLRSRTLPLLADSRREA